MKVTFFSTPFLQSLSQSVFRKLLTVTLTSYVCNSLLLAQEPNPSPSEGSQKVAKALIVKGIVKAKEKDQGEVVDVKEGAWLNEGTLVQTADKSFIKLIFADKSQMNLGPNSKMFINQFPKDKPGLISLINGQLRSQVTKDVLKKNEEGNSKLFVKTKSAAMGVRGTDFQVIFNQENAVTSLVTFTGEVSMNQLNPQEPMDTTTYTNLEKIVSGPDSVSVKQGQYSGTNPNFEKASIPTKISPAQFETMKQNTEFQEGEKAQQEKKNFNSPIPPGVNTKSFVNSSDALEKTLESSLGKEVLEENPGQATPNAGANPGEGAGPDTGGPSTAAVETGIVNPPPEGFVDEKTGKFAPPAGGFVDLNTGLYVPPPEGSVFDSNTGVYVPPPTMGGFDPVSGNYVPPAGLKLDATGNFVVNDNPKIPSADKVPNGPPNKGDGAKEEKKEGKPEGKAERKPGEKSEGDKKDDKALAKGPQGGIVPLAEDGKKSNLPVPPVLNILNRQNLVITSYTSPSLDRGPSPMDRGPANLGEKKPPLEKDKEKADQRQQTNLDQIIQEKITTAQERREDDIKKIQNGQLEQINNVDSKVKFIIQVN